MPLQDSIFVPVAAAVVADAGVVAAAAVLVAAGADGVVAQLNTAADIDVLDDRVNIGAVVDVDFAVVVLSVAAPAHF